MFSCSNKAFTSAGIAAWQEETQTIDTVKWHELASQMMDVTRELEQEVWLHWALA